MIIFGLCLMGGIGVAITDGVKSGKMLWYRKKYGHIVAAKRDAEVRR